MISIIHRGRSRSISHHVRSRYFLTARDRRSERFLHRLRPIRSSDRDEIFCDFDSSSGHGRSAPDYEPITTGQSSKELIVQIVELENAA